ncbi:MAG: metalloregulator ArsR/SmtB family transcription factor [Oscillospiraceae bacterium]|nr:metalloregulator ArsR/SmtB family transcription factor [Oscillospiraceae bacterium]
MDTNEKRIATIFKAFCDENRIHVLKLLIAGEKCACDLLDEIKITQPTLSHHMKILCDAEIVIPRKEGKWTYYSLNPDGVEKAKRLLSEITQLQHQPTQN